VLSLFLSFFSSQSYKWLESVSIFSAVILATLIQALCAYGKDRQFLELKRQTMESSTTVVRGQYGTAQMISAADLVVGDVIKLEAGDRVPADCVLFEEQDMFVDERELITTV
jgi:P-type Ca2+ transporter type 2C